MTTSTVAVADPVFHPDRACAGTGQEVFFPRDARCTTDIARAARLCRVCPWLRACAAWAVPLVAAGDLSGCVVAAVYVAPPKARHQAQREAALAELAGIAGLDNPADQIEGAA